MKFAFFNKNNEEEQKAITDCCVLEFLTELILLHSMTFCHCNDKTISQSVVKIKTKIYVAKNWML